jgi:hypothetical protein
LKGELRWIIKALINDGGSGELLSRYLPPAVPEPEEDHPFSAAHDPFESSILETSCQSRRFNIGHEI